MFINFTKAPSQYQAMFLHNFCDVQNACSKRAQWHTRKTCIKPVFLNHCSQRAPPQRQAMCLHNVCNFQDACSKGVIAGVWGHICRFYTSVLSMCDDQAPRWSQVAPRVLPGYPQDGPSKDQDCPSKAQDVPSCAQEAPKSSQDSQKIASTWPIIASMQHVFVILWHVTYNTQPTSPARRNAQ